jgi:hypothetical protein
MDTLTGCLDAAGSGSGPFVIVVDQMEEIFTTCRDDAQRHAFIGALSDMAAPGAAKSLVVLGLRADFYARAAEYPVLRAALQRRQIVVGAMSPAEVRDAITQPALVTGFAPGGRSHGTAAA